MLFRNLVVHSFPVLIRSRIYKLCTALHREEHFYDGLVML